MAPGAASAKVRSALRAHLVLVGAESTLLGSSAGLLTLSAAVAAGAAPSEPAAILVAGFCTVLGAVSWWCERRNDAASIARAIDRNAGLGGAFFTAFETDSLRSGSSVARLLAEHAAAQASPRRFLRVHARSSATLLAVPFVFLALFAAVVEADSTPNNHRGESSRTAELADGVLDVAARVRADVDRLLASPSVSEEETRALRALAEDAAKLRDRSALGRDSSEELLAEARELWLRLERLLAAPISRGVTAGSREGTMGDPDPTDGDAPDDPMRDAPPSDRPVADTPPPIGTPAPGSGGEGGVGESRWWPERYDAVVERWVESRRKAGDDRPR